MTNYVCSGKTLTVTASRTVAAGDGILVGGIFGVAKNSAVSGATDLEVGTEEVWDIAKAAGVITAGARMYWDNTAFVVTTTSAGNTHIGTATQAQLTGDATCRVKLNVTSAAGRFKSTEQTGTGSAQNVAHGLGVIPGIVIFYPSDTSPATVGVFVLTEGTHTATNVVVTVTTGKKFFVVAFV